MTLVFDGATQLVSYTLELAIHPKRNTDVIPAG
jgi:hypothetical protein